MVRELETTFLLVPTLNQLFRFQTNVFFRFERAGWFKIRSENRNQCESPLSELMQSFFRFSFNLSVRKKPTYCIQMRDESRFSINRIVDGLQRIKQLMLLFSYLQNVFFILTKPWL